ncbi:MAG: cell division protein FtsW, partial [Oscillospiraceae bacterium]|nr:cell division protein FtsW [Oscillospiraceae bacterium]
MSWLKDSLQDFWERGDKLLLALCLMASGYGLALIYSATRYLHSNRSVVVQAAGILLGVVVYLLISSVDIDLFVEKTWKLLLLFNLGFNLLVRVP